MERVKNFTMECAFEGYSDFDMQMKEKCDAFYEETKMYPSSVVANSTTYNIIWQVMDGKYDASRETSRKNYYWDENDPECECSMGDGHFIYGTKIDLKLYESSKVGVGKFVLRFGDGNGGDDGEEWEDAVEMCA